MAFDLALSEHNDLIFAANRDLQGVTGVELVEQRIRLRLKMVRGSWVYDADGDIGSNVHSSLGKVYDRAASEIPTFVRQALSTMEDISVDDVQLVPSDDNRSTEIKVGYHLIIPDVETLEQSDESEILEFSLDVPLGAA